MNRLAVALAVSLLAVSPQTHAEDQKDTLTKVGDAAPAFAIKTLDGQTLTPDSTKGKVVLINFFATWCGPCVAEMPHLQKQVYERFKDNPNFVLVAVAREQTEKDVKPFIEQRKLTFPFACDEKRETYAKFAKQYIPRNYVIGPDGKILFQSVGYNDKEFAQMIETIEKALGQTAAPAAK